jgi:hypothetical protein
MNGQAFERAKAAMMRRGVWKIRRLARIPETPR